MRSVDARAAEIGRRQHGLASREQLRGLGIADTTVRRRLVSGRWAEPLPGVVDLRTHPSSWHGRLQGLLLAAGPEACASHGTAAYLHGFLDVPRPHRLDVLVPRRRHARVGPLRLHTTVMIGADEVVDVAGYRCTCAARTLVDLAATRPMPVLERLALDLGRRSPRELSRVNQLLRRRPGAPGVARLDAVLQQLPVDVARIESPLEVLGLARLGSAGLPSPTLQYEVRDVDGRYLKRVDAAWPDRLVVVEFDGLAYHGTSQQREADAQIRARMRELGWAVIVLGAADLTGPAFEAAVGRLRRALL
jgi:hypothetical protein